MSIVRGQEACNNIRISQKLSKPNQFGAIMFGYSKFGHFNNSAGIYQQRHGKTGRINVKEKFYWPANPQTVAQQANRAKYANSVLAWQALTYVQKTEYNNRARRLPYSGYNLFQKEFMLNS